MRHVKFTEEERAELILLLRRTKVEKEMGVVRTSFMATPDLLIKICTMLVGDEPIER